MRHYSESRGKKHSKRGRNWNVLKTGWGQETGQSCEYYPVTRFVFVLNVKGDKLSTLERSDCLYLVKTWWGWELMTDVQFRCWTGTELDEKQTEGKKELDNVEKKKGSENEHGDGKWQKESEGWHWEAKWQNDRWKHTASQRVSVIAQRMVSPSETPPPVKQITAVDEN